MDLDEKTLLRKMPHQCCDTITSPAPGLSQKKPAQICISCYIFSCDGLGGNEEDFSETDLLLTWLCIFSVSVLYQLCRLICKRIRLKIHMEESIKANSKNAKKALNCLCNLLPS